MFLFIPSNENGVIVDPYAAANLQALRERDPIRNLLLYSHGWWTSAIDAMISYNRFAVGLNGAAQFPTDDLAVGIHWPSMLSENPRDWLNLVESASFFTMEQRAEHVGRHGVCDLLRLILQQRHATPEPTDAFHIHLLGHSFGCKVVCAALAELIDNSPAQMYENFQFNLTLLQPAIEDDALAPTGRYGNLSHIPHLRILTTKSSQDTALCIHFKRAHTLEFFDHEDRTALGATGPSASTISAFGGAAQLTIGSPECTSEARNAPAQRLLVADLSPIHRQRAATGIYKPKEFSGQHSDIYFGEIYRLLADFLAAG